MTPPFRIVALDDERESLELVTPGLSLSPLPLELIRFDDAEAALDYLRATHVDLVLTDLHMPGMDGRTAIREFRKIDGTPPIVVASAEAMPAGEASALGASAFVPKAALNEERPAAVFELLLHHHLPR